MYVTQQGGVYPISEPSIYIKYARYQGTFLSILSSRGCPFSCNYCCNSMLQSLYGNKKVRKRKPENVIDEILCETNKFKDVLYVNFQDDCFMMYPLDWLETFARLYIGKIGIPFVVRSTPRHLNRKKVAILKETGMRWVFMGLQSGSDEINKNIFGRKVTSKEFLKAAKVLNDFHISCWN